MADFDDVDKALACGRGLLKKESNSKHAELSKQGIESLERLKAGHDL